MIINILLKKYSNQEDIRLKIYGNARKLDNKIKK